MHVTADRVKTKKSKTAREGQENLLTSPSVYSVFDPCRPSVRTSPPHRLSRLRRPDAGRGEEQTRSVKRWVNIE